MNIEKAIKGCLHNQRQSQEWLYKTYAAKLLPLCRRFSSNEDDVISYLNDSFMKIFKSIHTLDDASKFEPWSKRIIYNTIYDHLRKEKKHRFLIEITEAETTVSDRPQATDNLYEEDILQLLEDVPAKSAEIFVMYAIHGYTHKEIAENKGISEGTSKWHLSEARKKLQYLLIQQEQKLKLHVSER